VLLQAAPTTGDAAVVNYTVRAWFVDAPGVQARLNAIIAGDLLGRVLNARVEAIPVAGGTAAGGPFFEVERNVGMPPPPMPPQPPRGAPPPPPPPPLPPPSPPVEIEREGRFGGVGMKTYFIAWGVAVAVVAFALWRFCGGGKKKSRTMSVVAGDVGKALSKAFKAVLFLPPPASKDDVKEAEQLAVYVKAADEIKARRETEDRERRESEVREKRVTEDYVKKQEQDKAARAGGGLAGLLGMPGITKPEGTRPELEGTRPELEAAMVDVKMTYGEGEIMPAGGRDSSSKQRPGSKGKNRVMPAPETRDQGGAGTANPGMGPALNL